MAEDKFLRGIKSNIPLTGTDDEIKTQLSLLLGTAQLVEAQAKGLDIDFYKFVEMFEDGFSTGFLAKRNESLNPKYWGQTQKARPRIRVLQESSKTWQKQGYALVEFQPDRTVEEESYLLFGTPAQLIQEIMYWMNMHRRLNNINVESELLYQILAAIEREPEPFNPIGHPKIKLLFLENSFTFKTKKAKDPDITRGEAQLSFRLMNQTNENYTKAEAKALAEKIKNKFINPVFKFVKGKEHYIYFEKKLGKKLTCWTKNQAEAEKLFEQTLDLVGDSPDLEKMVKRSNLNPSKAYDDTPGKKIILGEPTKLDRVRPIVEVEFSSAYLSMDGIKTPICLVDRHFRRKSLVSLN